MSNKPPGTIELYSPLSGFEIGTQTEVELIRKFQHLEGSLTCYNSTYSRVCNQSVCLWREKCLAAM